MFRRRRDDRVCGLRHVRHGSRDGRRHGRRSGDGGGRRGHRCGRGSGGAGDRGRGGLGRVSRRPSWPLGGVRDGGRDRLHDRCNGVAGAGSGLAGGGVVAAWAVVVTAAVAVSAVVATPCTAVCVVPRDTASSPPSAHAEPTMGLQQSSATAIASRRALFSVRDTGSGVPPLPRPYETSPVTSLTAGRGSHQPSARLRRNGTLGRNRYSPPAEATSCSSGARRGCSCECPVALRARSRGGFAGSRHWPATGSNGRRHRRSRPPAAPRTGLDPGHHREEQQADAARRLGRDVGVVRVVGARAVGTGRGARAPSAAPGRPADVHAAAMCAANGQRARRDRPRT